MNMLDGLQSLVDAHLAEVAAGGLEPDGIALALGNQTANTPAALGWGTDLSCGLLPDGTIDCDEYMSEVDPHSPVGTAQAIQRFLSTPTGLLINDEELQQAVGEDATYGYNIIQLLNQPVDAKTLQAHTDLAANAVLDHFDQVSTCTITQQATQIESGTQLQIYVYGELTTGESYSLVMPLNSTTLDTVTNG